MVKNDNINENIEANDDLVGDSSSIEEITIEAAMERMYEIQQIIENGEISLNESVKLFEEASKLYKICNDKLNALEERVKILQKSSDGGLEKTVFRTDD